MLMIIILSILIPISIIILSLCVAINKSNELLNEKILNESKDI